MKNKITISKIKEMMIKSLEEANVVAEAKMAELFGEVNQDLINKNKQNIIAAILDISDEKLADICATYALRHLVQTKNKSEMMEMMEKLMKNFMGANPI